MHSKTQPPVSPSQSTSVLTVNFVSNGSIQTAYQDIGDGTPLLLVHGFTGSKLDFQNQIPWFADTHRVIAYDQRGHGESSNQGPYTLYTLIGDLVGLLDALAIDRCHVLGHSLGGMVVMRALLSHPERFSSAILMDTAPYAPGLLPGHVRKRLNDIVADQGCDALIEGMRDQPQNDAVKRGINYLGEMEHWRRIQVKLEQMDPQAFIELGDVLSDHAPITPSLKQITQPVTVMVGKKDVPFITPSKELAREIPDAQLVYIDDAAHSPQYENPEAWRSAVESHLEQHSS